MNLEKYFTNYEQAHLNKYNRLCHSIGIPVIVVSILILIFGKQDLGWVLFTIGWIFQFIGHAIEKTWPEFFKNPIYLLIGPLYFLNKIKKRWS